MLYLFTVKIGMWEFNIVSSNVEEATTITKELFIKQNPNSQFTLEKVTEFISSVLRSPRRVDCIVEENEYKIKQIFNKNICGYCECEEGTGKLIKHCGRCCRKIVDDIISLFEWK